MKFQVNWISQGFRSWHLKVQKSYKSSKQEHFQKKVHILKIESLLKQLSRNNLSKTNYEVADPKPFQLETYAKARWNEKKATTEA